MHHYDIISGGILAIAFGLAFAWVGINFIAGCGAIDPITRTADLDACILYPDFIAPRR